ncbi:MAG: response regulator [Rhodomicrobiaceae bacterium]
MPYRMNDVILLVEDNPDDEELAIRALRKNNITNRIVVARDGVEALDLLFGNHEREPLKPAVVLMDLKLPKLDGVETLERIRANEETRNLPVVMLTTSDQESDVVRSYESGVNSYVRKPIEFGELMTVSAQLGLYWLLLNQRPRTGPQPED